MDNKKEKTKRIATLIMSLVGLIGLGIAIILFVIDSSLETISVETDATILSLEYEYGKRYATVTYKVDKKDYIISTPLDATQEDLAINDQITIKYDIRNPGKLIYNNHLIETVIIALISIILIITTLPNSLKYLGNYKKLKKLKTTGIKLEATIVDIFVDIQKPQYQKKYPYRVRAKYVNPTDNQEYTYSSDYTYKDLKELLKETKKETITVYIDKENPNNYYVDLNSLK